MTRYLPLPVTKFFFGVDLGRDQDHSAIGLIERIELTRVEGMTASIEYKFNLTFLERIPLATPYPDVIQRVKDAIRRLLLNVNAYPTLVVDGTGVGAPLVDDFRKMRSDCYVVPVIITSGSSASERKDGTRLIPRRDLLMAVHMLVENGQLQIPQDLPYHEDLLREALNLSHDGTPRSTTEHDDLIMSVALAAHSARRLT